MNKRIFHLMTEDMRRRLYIGALSSLFCFFRFPVSTILMFSGGWRHGSATGEMLDEFVTVYDNTAATFSLSALAFISVITGFAYLTKANRTDLFHSLSVGRNRIFTAVMLSSLILVLLPYMVLSGAAGLIAAGRMGSFAPMLVILKNWSFNVPRTMLAGGVTAFCMMLTGRKVIAVLLSVFVNFYIPFIRVFVEGLYDGYFKTFVSTTDWFEDGWFKYMSPFIFIMSKPESEPAAVMIYCAGTFAAAFFFIAAAFMLYRVRPSESARKTMAFRIAEAPVKFAIVIPAGISGGAVGYSIDDGFGGWTVFGLICGVVITHCIIEIIYNADFKKLFSKRAQLAACFAIAVFIFSSFAFDIFGYDRYIPAEGDYEYAGIYCEEMEPNIRMLHEKYVLDENRYYGTFNSKLKERFSGIKIADSMKLKNHELISDIARMGVESLDDSLRYDKPREIDEAMTDITLCYHRSMGGVIRRKYRVPLSQLTGYIERLYDESGFKMAVYPALSMDESEVMGAFFQDAFGLHRVKAGHSDLEELLVAYKADLLSMTSERREAEDPLFCIQFRDEEMTALERAAENADSTLGENQIETGFYPVYPSFTSTMDALKKCGVDVTSALRAEAYDYFEVSYAGGDAFYTNQKPDMQAILDNSYPDLIYKEWGRGGIRYGDTNNRLMAEGQINSPYVAMDVEGTIRGSCRFFFVEGRIPFAVKRWFNMD